MTRNSRNNPPQPYSILKATYPDIDILEQLYNDLNDYLSSTVNYPGWIKGIYPTKETAEEGINNETLFILKEKDNIAGSIILNQVPEKAYDQVKWKIETGYSHIMVVRTLTVHPHFMKRKIASHLMNFAKTYAIEKGMKSIRLDVSIHNTPAISLYEKFGFEYIGTVDLGLNYPHLKWFNLYELVL